MAPQPPFAGSGIQETAERFRRALSSLLAPHGGTGQVTTAWPNPMQVTATGPASLTVNVQPGELWVPGTLSTAQGQYYCFNDAIFGINLTAGGTGWTAWTAPSSGNSQIIVIVGIVYDTDYSQTMPDGHAAPWSEFNLIPIFGTAAASPSFPTLPQNSIALANFTVTSTTTSITSAMINDMRIPSAFANLPGAVPIGGEQAYYGGAIPQGFLLEDNTSYPQATYPSLYAVIGTTYNQTGDPANTFRVPDSRGRATIGAGTGPGLTARTLGQGAITALQTSPLGEENHVLSTAELANHNHPDSGHTHGTNNASHTHGKTDPGHGHSNLSTGLGLPVVQDSASTLGPVGAGGGVGSSIIGQGNSAFSIGSHTTGLTVNSATTGLTVNTGNASNAAAGTGTGHNTMQPSLVATKMIRAF